jgi:hypothetical protein
MPLSRAIDLVYALVRRIWEKVDDLDYKEKFLELSNSGQETWSLYK